MSSTPAASARPAAAPVAGRKKTSSGYSPRDTFWSLRRRRERWGSAIGVLALLGPAHRASGHLDAALVCLERARRRVAPEGYVRTFVDEGPAMRGLLRDARERRILTDHVGQLLSAGEAAPAPRDVGDEGTKSASGTEAPGNAPLAESIAEREIEVPRLIAADYSNQEIGDTLVIALGTVRKHVSNLYGKLAVRRRTRALLFSCPISPGRSSTASSRCSSSVLSTRAKFGLFIITRGRSYHLAPAYPMLIAAGGVAWERRLASLPTPWSRPVRGITWGGLVAGGALSAALALPIAPVNSGLWQVTSRAHDTFVEEIGRPELVDAVAAVYATLPPDERFGAAILAGNYGEAGGDRSLWPRAACPRRSAGRTRPGCAGMAIRPRVR